MTDFRFEFVDGRKMFTRGVDALDAALRTGHLNRGDRGSLAVALFDGLHATEHFDHASGLRNATEAAKLTVLAQALVDEAPGANWGRGRRHRFQIQLEERQPRLLAQLERYGAKVS